jgi:hypothetical protein
MNCMDNIDNTNKENLETYLLSFSSETEQHTEQNVNNINDNFLIINYIKYICCNFCKCY